MKKTICTILLSAVTSAFGANTYFGSSVGYLTDSEEAYYTARVGTDVVRTEKFTHSVEGEVGITREHEAGYTLQIVPVMANYRFTAKIAETKLDYYAGAGAGVSRAKLTGWGHRDSAWTFTAQAVAGIQYNVTPTFALTAGGRYLWLDDVTLFGIGLESEDDFAVEVGVRFRF